MNELHCAAMRLYFSIAFSIIWGQISSAFLPRDVSDEVHKTDPPPTEPYLSSNEDLSLWGLGTEPGSAPPEPDETQLDQDPLFSSNLIANSDFSSCENTVKQNSKIRRRVVSELCPNDQADPPRKGAESPNLDVPNIYDGSTEKALLEMLMPALDLSSSRQMCTNKKFVTHVCCDGPTGPWQPDGFFATVEKCWPCTSVQISINILIVQPVDDGCKQIRVLVAVCGKIFAALSGGYVVCLSTGDSRL